MAKKELKDSLFEGGSIADGEKNKKAAKSKSAAAKKKAAKVAAKRTKYETEIKELKVKLAEETDESKKQEISKQISKAKDKLDSVGNGITVAKNTKRTVQAIVAAVLVVAILVTYVATGAVRKGFIHSTLQWTTGLTAVTVKSDDGDKLNIPVSVYNFYYATTYNSLQQTQSLYKQYGLDLSKADLDVDFDKSLANQKTTDEDNKVITWEQKLQGKVIDSIQNVYTFYNEAVKANDGKEPEITEEQQKQIDDTLKSYKEAANKYGFTLSAYLVKAMGKGVTESIFRQESKRSYIAENYEKSISEEKEAVEYSAEDLIKYKDEHLDEFTSVDIKIFEAENADKAADFKKELKADGSNFAELCVKYSKSDFDKDYFNQPEASTQFNATKSTLKAHKYAIATADDVNSKDNEKKYSGLDWLFSAVRKAGDINQYSTTVVYVISPAGLSDAELVNVRHILITPDDNSKNNNSAKNASSKEWEDAFKEAENVLNEYKNGEKTEDGFAELAKKYSADGSANDGGLYENVYPGQMVDAFNAWCFDSNRKTGDVDIVKTEFGYHVMYFAGTTGTKVWENSAKAALTEIDSKTEADEIAEKYTAKINWFGSRYIEKDVDIDR